MDFHELRIGGNRCIEFTSDELRSILDVAHNNFEKPASEELKSAWGKLITLLQASVLLQGTVKLTF